MRDRLRVWVAGILRQLQGLPVVRDESLSDLHGKGDRGELTFTEFLAFLQNFDGLKVIDAA